MELKSSIVFTSQLPDTLEKFTCQTTKQIEYFIPFYPCIVKASFFFFLLYLAVGRKQWKNVVEQLVFCCIFYTAQEKKLRYNCDMIFTSSE